MMQHFMPVYPTFWVKLKALLQKIEELTLYLIEQEKRNNKQSLEIEVLGKENEVLKSVLERLSKIEGKLK